MNCLRCDEPLMRDGAAICDPCARRMLKTEGYRAREQAHYYATLADEEDWSVLEPDVLTFAPENPILTIRRKALLAKLDALLERIETFNLSRVKVAPRTLLSLVRRQGIPAEDGITGAALHAAVCDAQEAHMRHPILPEPEPPKIARKRREWVTGEEVA